MKAVQQQTQIGKDLHFCADLVISSKLRNTEVSYQQVHMGTLKSGQEQEIQVYKPALIMLQVACGTAKNDKQRADFHV